jgi:phosphohistidine phosphatase
MKRLLVIRHAKSSWDLSTLTDFERPLNERGKKDAPVMAQRLLDRKINIDVFISSPAKRAKKTAEFFCKAYNRNTDQIIFIPALYHASVSTFYEVVCQLNNAYNCAAVFSHNPGITEFVNLLSEAEKIANMPTCGVFAIQINTTAWKDFSLSKKDLLFFDYPKADKI